MLSTIGVLSKLLGFFIAPFVSRASRLGGHYQSTEEARSNNQLQEDKTTIFRRLCLYVLGIGNSFFCSIEVSRSFQNMSIVCHFVLQ
jgi:hypothetical protein